MVLFSPYSRSSLKVCSLSTPLSHKNWLSPTPLWWQWQNTELELDLHFSQKYKWASKILSGREWEYSCFTDELMDLLFSPLQSRGGSLVRFLPATMLKYTWEHLCIALYICILQVKWIYCQQYKRICNLLLKKPHCW